MIKDIKQEIKDLQKSLQKLNTHNKLSAFVLGLTGSGKSSFISYNLGAQMKFQKSTKGGWNLAHNDTKKYPLIGNTNESCTVIPSIYESKDKDFIFYDPPGFLDTKGAKQEILNSFANAKMFKKGSKAKIILVVEQGSIYSARGGPLVGMAHILRQLFQNDFRQVVKSCGLIVSKVNPTDLQIHQVQAYITDLCQKNKTLGPQCQLLLRELVQNKRIAFFPLPKFMNPQKLSQIKNFITRIPQFVVVNDPTISLSSDAKIMVDSLINETLEEMAKQSHKLGQRITNTFNRNYTDMKQLEEALLRLRSAIKMIAEKEIESGIPTKVAEFSQKVCIPQQQMNNFNDLMNRLEFCITLYPKANVTQKTSQIFMMYLMDVQKHLQGIFQKNASQEQKKQLEKAHQKNIEQQTARFQKERQSMKKDYEKMEKQINDRINNDQQKWMNIMMQNSKQHNAMMAGLTQQLVQLASRPPPESSGGCQIM